MTLKEFMLPDGNFIFLTCLHVTQWTLGDMAIITDSQISNIQTQFKDRYLEHYQWNCPKMIATMPHWSLVNIGKGKTKKT